VTDETHIMFLRSLAEEANVTIDDDSLVSLADIIARECVTAIYWRSIDPEYNSSWYAMRAIEARFNI
jgi:hypothetical protein